MRLQRFLSQAGVTSRRKAEELIVSGRVSVNGVRVDRLGTSVAEADVVMLDGSRVAIAPERIYLALHKPPNVVTTLHDPQGRHTIADLLPANSSRVVPVGRLDYDTSGLLLLTNDGDLAHRLMHPRFGVEKTYRAIVAGRFLSSAAQSLQRGVELDDGLTAPAKVRIISAKANRSTIDISIHEGRKRQIRRMFEAVGHRVLTLERRKFGTITLGRLELGRMRPLGSEEIAALRACVTKTGRPWNNLPRFRKNIGSSAASPGANERLSNSMATTSHSGAKRSSSAPAPAASSRKRRLTRRRKPS